MERIDQLTELTDDLAQLEKQKRDVAILHLSIIHQEKVLAENKEKLEAAKDILNSTLSRIDIAFSSLYLVQHAPGEETKKPRGKKAKEPAAEPAAEEPKEKFPCHLCDDIYYNPATLAKHLHSEHGLPLESGEESKTLPAPENPVAVENQQDVALLGKSPVPPSKVAQFFPLDEPHGECELCMGYGVIDGELYGKAMLVPCTCEAGIKVKGGELPSACDDCNVENPDCASCHAPDMDAPFVVETAAPAELPKCVNRNCTAMVPKPGKPTDVCLRLSGKECKSFVAIESCQHLKRSTNPDGSVTCDLCGFIIRPKGSVKPTSGGTAPQDQAPKPDPNSLKGKCTHPKIFRETVPEGIRCKVCKTIIGQPELFAGAGA